MPECSAPYRDGSRRIAYGCEHLLRSEMALPDLVNFVWNHPLNSSGRIAALGRVARWQMASRLVSGPIALPFVEGTTLFASRGMTGATGNW